MNRFEMAYTVLGGLGVFFLGMKFLSESLQAVAGDFIRKIINWLTSNRILAVLVGTLVTTIVQSSSVTTVMVVGMVNAGLMNLTQSIGVIFGANIGTTITGWIIAIKVGKYGLLFIALGAFPMFFTKNDNWKAAGKLLVALGFVFLGLKFMSGAFKPLRTDPDFLSLLHYFTADTYLSVLGCIAVGCLLTIIVQSSSAMLGITIALATTGVITFQTAMALVLGENIGTTITAILASIGANTNAKRAARAHACFNLLGVFVMSIIFWNFVEFVDYLIGGDPNMLDAQGEKPNIASHIAFGHSMFNVTASILFLPFLGYLAQFVTWITPAKGEEKERLLSFAPTNTVPALALEQAQMEVDRMLVDLKSLLSTTKEYISLTKDNPKLLDTIVATEDRFDVEQKNLTLYLCNVMESALTPEQSALGYSLIRTSDEIESVSDYCVVLAKLFKKTFKTDQKPISGKAQGEFLELMQEVNAYYDMVMAFNENSSLDSLEEYKIKSHQINTHAERIRDRHLERIKAGECHPITGLTFSDMILAARRIKNHSVNIMDSMISSKTSLKNAS